MKTIIKFAKEEIKKYGKIRKELKPLLRKSESLSSRNLIESEEYLIVSKRIKELKDLTTPQKVVQSSHAAIEVAQDKKFFTHPSMVVIGIKDELSLIKEMERIRQQGIKPYPFSDSYFNELTSVAFYVDNEDDRKVFKKYKLLNK